MEIQNILTLIQAFTEHSLTELNVEDSGVKVCLKREAGAAASGMPMSVPAVGAVQAAVSNMGDTTVQQGAVSVSGTGAAQGTVPVSGSGVAQGAVPVSGAAVVQAAVAASGSATVQAAVPGLDSDQVVTSPLVGIFYSASSPGAEDFVKVGDRVKKGQILGIIEAMKLMNEIESEYDGVVEAILVKNEDVVEYGQPLFRIR